MTELSRQQRIEVKEIVIENNPVLLSSIKEAMHEAIDPLKESVNKSLGHHEVLMAKVNENTKKIEQLFIFKNDGDEQDKKKDMDLLSLKKDVERAVGDINGVGLKLVENSTKDDELSDSLRDIQTANKTLQKVGSIALTIMGLIIAWLELRK